MARIKTERIVWQDLPPLEGLGYCPDGKNESRWTQKAWSILAKEELTKFADGNGYEKIKVFSRYIALSVLRDQFSEIINYENSITSEFDIDYSNFIPSLGSLGITSFDLGYLMALEKDWVYAEEDLDLQESSALRFYVNKHSRKEVIDGLGRNLGDSGEIFVFFYKLIDWQADRSVLNSGSLNNMGAFSWIDNGFCL